MNISVIMDILKIHSVCMILPVHPFASSMVRYMDLCIE